MELEEHCKECRQKLGNEFREVHIWLDGLFKKYGFSHRQYRHNKEALEKIRKMFGNKAVEAGKLHIMSDLGMIPTKKQWKDADGWLSMWK